MTENRSSGRIQMPYAVRLAGVDANGCNYREHAQLDNLSTGGLFLRLGRELAKGAQVTLAVRLSTDPAIEVSAAQLAAKGKVLRVEPQPDGTYGVAVQFERRRVL